MTSIPEADVPQDVRGQLVTEERKRVMKYSEEEMVAMGMTQHEAQSTKVSIKRDV